MKPHPRIRKTVKWGGLAVTVLLLMLWPVSGLGAIQWAGRSGAWLALGYGQLHVGYFPVPGLNASNTGWRLERSRYSLGWSLGWYTQAPTGWQVFFPLWLCAGVSAGATALAWRLDTLARRRADPARCPRCRYDRSGLTASAACPECGAAAP